MTHVDKLVYKMSQGRDGKGEKRIHGCSGTVQIKSTVERCSLWFFISSLPDCISMLIDQGILWIRAVLLGSSETTFVRPNL